MSVKKDIVKWHLAYRGANWDPPLSTSAKAILCYKNYFDPLYAQD